MRSLIDILELSTEEIDALIDTAQDMIARPEAYADACRGKILGTLFFEPSTRTRLSFTSAMMTLGGNVLGFSEAASSSASKGESVADTVRMVSAYSDIIAMRHPKEGAPLVAAEHATVPVINAGDGGHFHPTQTLTDLFTIKRKKGRLEHLTVGLCGDLKFGRTVHSLIAEHRVGSAAEILFRQSVRVVKPRRLRFAVRIGRGAAIFRFRADTVGLRGISAVSAGREREEHGDEQKECGELLGSLFHLDCLSVSDLVNYIQY